MGSAPGAGGRPVTAAMCTLRPHPSTASSGTLLMDTSEYYLVVCFDPLCSMLIIKNSKNYRSDANQKPSF